jgi:hypothetical protein
MSIGTPIGAAFFRASDQSYSRRDAKLRTKRAAGYGIAYVRTRWPGTRFARHGVRSLYRQRIQREFAVSKSGQQSTKADEGGQRVPKSPEKTADKTKLSHPTGPRTKPSKGKKPTK